MCCRGSPASLQQPKRLTDGKKPKGGTLTCPSEPRCSAYHFHDTSPQANIKPLPLGTSANAGNLSAYLYALERMVQTARRIVQTVRIQSGSRCD